MHNGATVQRKGLTLELVTVFSLNKAPVVLKICSRVLI